MKTSSVRWRILTDHHHLRGLLEELDQRAWRVAEGQTDAVSGLRERGLELHACLGRHLAFEDRWLAPALEAAGLAGEQRAAQLGRDHAEQRELLDYVLAGLHDRSRPARLLAEELRDLVELLFDDMANEELTILDLLDPRGSQTASSTHPSASARPLHPPV